MRGTSAVSYFLVLLLIPISDELVAQGNGYELLKSNESSTLWFSKIVGIENINLINGPKYQVPYLNQFTNPFLWTNSKPGRLTISANHYDDIPMLYDIYSDILVLDLSRVLGIDLVQLDKHSVEDFEIEGHRFKCLDHLGRQEFFEVLTDGAHIKLLAKRIKTKEVQSSSRIEYQRGDKYFAQQEGKLYFVNRMGKWMQFISSKQDKKELKKHLKRARAVGRNNLDDGHRILCEQIDTALRKR